jgi:hypothetical protein
MTISPWRVGLLRAAYGLIVVGLGAVLWPHILFGTGDWSHMPSVVKCMLAAFSLLSLVGIFRPLAMLPVLFWEIGWKLLWLVLVALPRWQAGMLTEDFAGTAFECLPVVIIIAAIPWDYVYRHYARGVEA